MGIYAVYPKPNLSKRNFEESILPYLLRNYDVSFPNQVWSVDITYIPMPLGYKYLTAIIDWYSRRLVGHYLSDSLEANSVIYAVKETFKAYDSRTNSRIKRLLKESKLPSTKASIGDIAYLPERQLDHDLINRLETCDFITKRRNTLVLGATGAGKTILVNVNAVDTCRDDWRVLYVRLPDFFIKYANAAAIHKEF